MVSPQLLATTAATSSLIHDLTMVPPSALTIPTPAIPRSARPCITSGLLTKRPNWLIADEPPAHALAALELPLLGSNQDSPDPESGVLPVTPRGSGAEGARTP